MTGAAPLIYAREARLNPAEFVQVLVASGLGKTRPVADAARIARMLAGADLVMTARRTCDGELVGVARCITDFSWCCYVSELAVNGAAHGHGAGRGGRSCRRRRFRMRTFIRVSGLRG